MYRITQTNITIQVKDIHSSIQFYTEVLGFQLVSEYGNFYAQVSAPGIIMGLHSVSEAVNVSENISIGFTTEVFAAAQLRLDASSVMYTERAEAGGRFIHFTDPDGTPLYFIDPKK